MGACPMAYKPDSNRGWPKYSLGLSWRDQERLKKESQWKLQICGDCGLLVHYTPNGKLVHDNAQSAVKAIGIHLPWIKEKDDKRTALHKGK